MTSLTKGANVSLDASAVRAELSWSPGPGVPDLDVSALLLGADGRVASDADFVFYNQPRHPSGSVRHAGKTAGKDAVEVDLGAVPARVERVVLTASADGGTFGQVPGLRVVLVDRASNTPVAEFVISGAHETAMVAGELYRRDGRWKFRAVGQGYANGLAGLATDFGISVDDAPGAALPPTLTSPTAPPSAQPGWTPPPPPPPPGSIPPPPPPGSIPPPPPPGTIPPPPPPGSIPAPLSPSLDAGRVNLVKGARVSLVKSGTPPLSRVTMGLGWDPARGRRSIDLDASVIAFDADARVRGMAWFGNLSEFRGAIRHAGDNLTGQGEGDDEQIHIELSSVPIEVTSLVFTITSYRGHKFSEVVNAFCRLVDAQSGQELVRYNLSEARAATGVIMAVLRRTAAQTWEMRAIGDFFDGRMVKHLLKPAAYYAAAP